MLLFNIYIYINIFIYFFLITGRDYGPVGFNKVARSEKFFYFF